jgi:CheY-like chemotaxis protein
VKTILLAEPVPTLRRTMHSFWPANQGYQVLDVPTESLAVEAARLYDARVLLVNMMHLEFPSEALDRVRQQCPELRILLFGGNPFTGWRVGPSWQEMRELKASDVVSFQAAVVAAMNGGN